MEYLSVSEVKQLLNSVQDMRDRLMIRVLFETGCELSELVSIKVGDVLGHTIRFSKRFSQISGKLSKDLSEYIDGNKLMDYIFLTRQSENISAKRLRQLIHSYSLKILGRKINPQAIRYSHIIEAYSNGVLLDNIAKQVGIKPLRIFQVISKENVMKHNYNQFLGRI